MNILVAGDFCPRYRLQELVDSGEYERVLGEVKPVVAQAGYSIVNFECPVVEHEAWPIEKCGPNLKCSKHGAEALKWAGFDCVTLANNHFLDYGEVGVRDTLEACRELSIDTVGGGMNLAEASKILYREIDGKRLAIINCCEHEFSIATGTTAGSNPLNPIQQYYAIQEAKHQADYVLVIVHGGHEHWQLPSPRMVETYRFFVDAGADAVVNHHQHCYSGYEIYNGKPIFYGLGNFCFDINPPKQNDLWNYGYMVMLEFGESGVGYTIHPYEQCNGETAVKMLPSKAFEKRLNEQNGIIADGKRLIDETARYYDEAAKGIPLALWKTTNRYLRAAWRIMKFPIRMPKKYLIRLHNNMLCEAHRDKLYYFLKKKVEGR